MIMFLLILLLVVSAAAAGYATFRLLAEPSGWALAVAVGGGLTSVVCLLKLFGWAMLVFAVLIVVTLCCYAEWKKNQDATAKKILVTCTVLLLSLAAFRIVHNSYGAYPQSDSVKAKSEIASVEACWHTLGQYLSKRFSDTAVLVLEFPWMANSALEQTVRSGLQKGSDGRIKSVVCEPVTGVFTWEAYRTLLMRHPDCRMVVSFLGMPYGTAQPPQGTQPTVAKTKLIVLADIGLHESVAQAIPLGLAAAVLVDCKSKQGVTQLCKGSTFPALYGEAFHARYVLLDADNVGTILKRPKPAAAAK